MIGSYTSPEGAQDWAGLTNHLYRYIVRPIAVGGMLVGATYTLYRMRNNLIVGIRRGVADVKKSATAEAPADRTERDLPFRTVLFGIVALFILITALYFYFTKAVPAAIFAGIVIIVTAFFFAADSGNLVGMIGSSNKVAAGGITTFHAPAASPPYIGVGYIIGAELRALNFSGGLVAWGRFVGLSAEEAESAKRSGGLPDNYESDVLSPFRENVVTEIARAIQFFFTSTQYHEVDYIVLSGGCAALPGLDYAVATRTQVSTMVANPFALMTLSNRIKPRQLQIDALSLIIACGLAMRRFDPS